MTQPIKNSQLAGRCWLLSLTMLMVLCWPAYSTATPAIQHWQTSNGVRVLFVEARQLPLVDIQVVFDAGSARDGDRHGIARLTSGLLNDGAGELDVDQIAQRFEDLGAVYSASSERDSASVNLRSLSDNKLLQPAVETLALVLKDPTFPQHAFERERRRALVALRAQQEQPGSVASKTFYENLYEEHPYATSPLGTSESLQRLGRTDLAEFHDQYYVAANALVVIVGDVGRDSAEALAETVVGDLPQGRQPAALPPVPAREEGETITIDHPSTQTHVRSGQPGMTRGDEDYFPLYVGNHILGGGGLVSRLSEEIREKRGLSYSTYSYFQPMRVQGPFITGLQTKNEQTEQALRVMKDTLRDFVANGPTAKELKQAKQNLTGSFPLRIDSNAKIANYLAVIGFYDLPLDYLDTFIDHIESVNSDEIRKAFKRRLHPDKFLTVIVGGASGPAASQ